MNESFLQPLTQSRYYMWRTLFALTHVDGYVSDEEIGFMREALIEVPFSMSQREQLCRDMAASQDADILFDMITDEADQAEFFRIAHQLVHVDGDFGKEEQTILLALQEKHVNKVNIDQLSETVKLELEEEPIKPAPAPQPVEGENTLMKLLQKFFGKVT